MDNRIHIFQVSLLAMILLAVLLGSSGVPQGECPQAQQCMGKKTDDNGHCRWTGSMQFCIAELKNTCQLKEDHITFEQLGPLFDEYCQVISNASMFDCNTMGACVLGSELMRPLNTTSIEERTRFLLDSQNWCRYLEVTADCVVQCNSSQVDPHLMSYMRHQQSHMKAVCNSAQGGRAGLGSSILVLLLAVLTAGAHSFL